MALSGDTVVVGAWREASNATGVNGNQSNNSAPGAGAAYVFVRSGTTWTQQAYLKKGSNSAPTTGFGYSVTVSGDTVVVGAGGAAYAFVRRGTSWTQQAHLKPSMPGNFGQAVAVSGDTAVVGNWSENSSATGINGNQNDTKTQRSGAAFVFTGLGIARPVITGSSLLDSGAFQLRFTGAAGATYFVEGSTTNLRDWTPLGLPTETAPGEFDFIDTDAPNHGSQFYRVK